MFELDAMFEHQRMLDERGWRHAGLIAQVSLMPHLKKGAKPPDIEQFNPYSKKRKQASMTKEELLEILNSDRVKKLVRLHKEKFNGQDKRGTRTHPSG